MPGPRNKKFKIAHRREQLTELYLQGWSQTRIARHLEISQNTVSLDLRAIQKEWRESSLRDFDALRERELQKIDRLEREANAAWERSQKPIQEARMQGDVPNQRTQKRVKNQYGDPRFLEIVRKCIADRRALLGLDAPTKIAPTTPDGKSLVPHELPGRLEALLRRLLGSGDSHHP
jgi:transposase